MTLEEMQRIVEGFKLGTPLGEIFKLTMKVRYMDLGGYKEHLLDLSLLTRDRETRAPVDLNMRTVINPYVNSPEDLFEFVLSQVQSLMRHEYEESVLFYNVRFMDPHMPEQPRPVLKNLPPIKPPESLFNIPDNYATYSSLFEQQHPAAFSFHEGSFARRAGKSEILRESVKRLEASVQKHRPNKPRFVPPEGYATRESLKRKYGR